MSASSRADTVIAYKTARARIENFPKLMPTIRSIAGDHADALVDLVCWGECLFLTDPRFSQPKDERDASVRRIADAARELARALQETTWPGLGEHEVRRPQDDGPRKLSDYLNRLADWTDEIARNGPDFKDRYPPRMSKTTRRSFMIRHIKRTVNDVLREEQFERDALAAEIATAVLDDAAAVTEEDIRKA
jgi:hypothetical protein